MQRLTAPRTVKVRIVGALPPLTTPLLYHRTVEVLIVEAAQRVLLENVQLAVYTIDGDAARVGEASYLSGVAGGAVRGVARVR